MLDFLALTSGTHDTLNPGTPAAHPFHPPPLPLPIPSPSVPADTLPSLVGFLDHVGTIYDIVEATTASAVNVIRIGQIAQGQSHPFGDTARAAFIVITLLVVVVVVIVVVIVVVVVVRRW